MQPNVVEHPHNRATPLVVGLAAVAWVVVIQQMNDMDMTLHGLGGFSSFLNLWVLMIAAMMLPGVAPAVSRLSRLSDSALFVASYLVVWTLVGVALYALLPAYRPGGEVVIAAGLYELTPVKQHLRRRCGKRLTSGVDFGVSCVGSSVGLMLLQVVLGMTSATWMFAIAVVMIGQKLLPRNALIDTLLALAIVELGISLVVVPLSIPGFLPAM
jgi:predicted metal-binding membrane protein